MSKKVQKTLTAALATTLATGSMAIPAMAAPTEVNSDLDALYKAAYEATIKTQNLDKVTQNEINVAREAINKLRGTSVASAVPTFSAIVDKAQQKFLEIAYNSIVKCQETGTQKDINTARTNIQDLPVEFKNPYSMAIDVVQQKVIDKVYEAVEKAIKTQNAKDIEHAQALLDDILTVVHNDGVKKWAVETEVRFKKATAVLNIVSAEALNNNSVTVVFNRPIDPKSATAENFSVSPKGEAYDNLIVDKVQVAEDGMSVKITTINTFENKKDYVVHVSKIKDTFGNEILKNASAEFKYQIAAVKSIEFSTTNVALGSNLKDYVIIKDALGRNVTDEYKDKLLFTTSNINLIGTNGVVASEYPEGSNENKNNHVMVGVVVEGTDVKTSASLAVTRLAATTFQGYAIIKDNTPIDKPLSQLSKDEQLPYVTVGQEKVKLVVGFKNQNGEEINLDKSQFVVEQNYNPTIAIVSNDGSIQALNPGTAYVKIKCGNIEKTISIEVKAASVPNSISTSKDNYNLVATNESGININYTINNQYGDKYNGNQNVTTGDVVDTSDNSQKITDWTVKNSAGNIVNSQGATGDNAKDLVVSVSTDNNQITIKPLDGIETGTYTVTLARKFKYLGEEKTVTKDLIINVINGGTLAGYKVQLSSNKLDVNAPTNQGNQNGTPNEATATVYSVDAQGNELGTVGFVAPGTTSKDKAQLEILNSNGVDAIGADKGVTVNNNNTIVANKKGTYTVKVKVGTYVSQQITLTIVNTTPKPTAITVNSKTATIDENTNISSLLGKVGCEIVDQFGNNLNKNYELSGINYYVANKSGANVVTKNGTAINENNKSLTNVFDYTGINENGAKVNQGNLDLVIKSLKVKPKDKASTEEAKEIYFNDLLIKVTVNQKDNFNEAPKATTAVATDTALNINSNKTLTDVLNGLEVKAYDQKNNLITNPSLSLSKTDIADEDMSNVEITEDGRINLKEGSEVGTIKITKVNVNGTAITLKKSATVTINKVTATVNKDMEDITVSNNGEKTNISTEAIKSIKIDGLDEGNITSIMFKATPPNDDGISINVLGKVQGLKDTTVTTQPIPVVVEQIKVAGVINPITINKTIKVTVTASKGSKR